MVYTRTIKRYVSISALTFLLCFVQSAYAVSSAKQTLVKMSAEIHHKLDEGKREDANLLFLNRFDMMRFGKRCLIDHWSEFSNVEQKQFTELLFKNLLKQAREKNFFLRDGKTFRLVPQKEVKVAEGNVEVKNILHTSDKQLALNLFLHSEKGDYHIVDYEIEGALLSRNYRSHFNYLIKKYGKKGFFEQLEKKLERAS